MDLIERQEALYVLDEFQESVKNGTPCYAKARIEMCNIPSVQPDREPAKFIRWMECKKTDKYISYTLHCKCSKCGNELLIEAINYCYMCGARMEGERITDGTE